MTPADDPRATPEIDEDAIRHEREERPMTRAKERPCTWGCGRTTRRPIGICINCLPKSLTNGIYSPEHGLPAGRWECKPRTLLSHYVLLEDEVAAYAEKRGEKVACTYCWALVGERCVSESGQVIGDHAGRTIPSGIKRRTRAAA